MNRGGGPGGGVNPSVQRFGRDGIESPAAINGEIEHISKLARKWGAREGSATPEYYHMFVELDDIRTAVSKPQNLAPNTS